MRACPSCGEANPDRFSACAFCGTALAQEVPAQEERKVLTVVFCDLKDSTGLGERLDPEAMGEVLDLYFTAMTRVLRRHGGTIQKFIGDAIVAAFGIPVLHEDDALRAVRAAVEMREALVRLNRQLQAGYGVSLVTRTGVHTGEVVVREAVNEQQVLTGDTLNTAARLEQAAGADEILVGGPTYRLVRGAVEVEALPALDLKGKSEPVAAYRLLRVFGDEQASRRHLAPIVGREEELATLAERYAAAVAQRRCHLATVLGEAGVGKSRLVRALIESVGEEATVLRGRCLPYGESITFWPLLSITREAAGIEQDESPEAARARLEALTGDVEVARRVASALDWSREELPIAELFWGIREMLEGLARARPLVLVIDDVHWAAPTLLELIEHLVEQVTDAPIVLLCTARPLMLDAHPEWSQGSAAVRLALDRLPDEASAQVIRNMTGGLPLPGGITSTVLRAAEGNPLFVEQLVSMLIDEGTLVQAGDHWDVTRDLERLEVPPSIQALLSARLDMLESGERGVVDPASVIGLEFPSVAVGAIAAAPVRQLAADGLTSLVLKRLVRQEPSADGRNDYRFDHILVRDAAYAGVLKRARAELHERFAEWLESTDATGDRDEVIGYHLEQATAYRAQLGPLDDRARSLAARASAKLSAAGHRSFGRGDLPAAIDLLRRAHDTLPDDDPARVWLVPELAEALVEDGSFEEARRVLAEAEDAASDSASQCAKARSQLVRLLVDLYVGDEEGWVERAHREVDSVMPIFEAAGNEVGLTAAWRVRNLAYVTALRYDAGFEAAEQIIRHAAAAGDARQQRRGAVAYAIAALHGPSPVAEGIPRCEELIVTVEGDRRTQAVVQGSLAQLLAMDGQTERARAAYASARDMLSELGPSVVLASTSLDAGPVEILAGDLEAAERLLRADYAELERLGESYLRSTVAGLLAHVLAAREELDEAERVASEARSLAGPDDTDAQVLWRTSLARCCSLRGAHADAVRLAEEAVALTDGTAAQLLRADALTDAGVVLARAGRGDEAAEALSQALALNEAKGNRVGAASVRSLTATP